MGWEHLQPISSLFQPEYGGEINHTWSIWVGTPSAPLLVILGRELTFFTWPLRITFDHYWGLVSHGDKEELLIPFTCWMLLRIIPIDAECFGACLNLVTVRKQSSLFYEGTSTNLQYPLWTSAWARPKPDTFPWLPKRTCMAWFWWHQRCNHWFIVTVDLCSFVWAAVV